VLPPHRRDVFQKTPLHRRREHRDTVSAAFAAADRDVVSAEVEVLNAKLKALEQTQAAAVEQQRDQVRHAIEMIQDAADLVPREHHRQVSRALRADESSSHGRSCSSTTR
jgi:hypothetical protein